MPQSPPPVLQERAASPVLNLFGGGGTRKVESLATQVERQVESQRTRRGTQVGDVPKETASLFSTAKGLSSCLLLVVLLNSCSTWCSINPDDRPCCQHPTSKATDIHVHVVLSLRPVS